MNIENITVRYCTTGSFYKSRNDGFKVVKDLPYLSIVQATEGRYSFGLDGMEQRNLDCGDCFIAPALAQQEITHHTDETSGVMSARWVFMDIIVNDNIPFDLVFTLPTYPEKWLSDKINPLLDRILSSDNIIEKKIGCYELLKLLLPYANKKTDREPGVDSAVYYIQKHFKEHLTVKVIADASKMSPSNLHRLFKSSMGTSPIDYCNSLRLSHACMLLEHSTYSIEKIAAECGIDNPFYFSKLFKNKWGLSPAAYRKNLKSPSDDL